MVVKKEVSFIFIAIFVFSFFLFFFISNFNNGKFSMTGFVVYSSQPGAEGEDTYLRQDFGDNYGDETTMLIGKTGLGKELKSLIKFDISSISAGDTIALANLQLYAETATNTENITIRIYRMTSEWNETATNWTHRTPTEIWDGSGASGDYDSTALDTVQFTNQSGVYYNFTITPVIKNWLNGSYNNYGLIIIGSGIANGEIITLSSSDSATSAQRPLLFIDHDPNFAPVISTLTQTTTSTTPTKIGDLVNFTATWSDEEGDASQLFVCNTSECNSTGCINGTFCSTSTAQTNPAICSYTVLTTNNRTTNFWAFVCDGNNCSNANSSQFYINHLPTIEVKQPNGGETINITAEPDGYTITFNFSDADSDKIMASIYYGNSQNSTTTSLNSSVNLTQICNDPDSNPATVPNNCNYNWNTTNLYGAYYLTILVNDSFHSTNDSSDASFNIYSLIDSEPPNISSQWIDSGTIYSGKTINFYANVSDPNINTVWVSINTTPESNYTMLNTSSIQYNYTWTAIEVGNYKFKVWANDTKNNVNNSMSWTGFSITKPNATVQNITAPSSALPYHTIQVTGQLNATDPLRDVYAYLTIPNTFTFLSNYSQNSLMGNFTTNQTKTATWFLGTPISEATYSLNITYTDNFNNQWNSSNTQVQITSGIGGYEVSMAGYPEVSTGSNYYAESYFKQSGTYTSPDFMKIRLYDGAGNPATDWVSMTEESTGIYNYTYTTGGTTGKWETIVNATKSGISYYTHEFWDLLGGPFDVGNIVVTDSSTPKLGISLDINNTGGSSTDYLLTWNLTNEATGERLDYSQSTSSIRIDPYDVVTRNIEPSTSFVGQVRLTCIVYYGENLEKTAGAYKVFSTTQGTTPTPGGGSTGGGGGVSATTPTPVETKKSELQIRDFEKEIYLTKNLGKTITITIENTGDTNLTNISIELIGLDKTEYIVKPKSIDLLEPGKTKEIEIILLILDFIGEKDSKYKIKTNELTLDKDIKIIVLSLREYFLKEIEIYKDKILDLTYQLQKDEKTNLLDNLARCSEMLNQLTSSVEAEEFINAEDKLKNLEECVKDVEKEADKEKMIDLGPYWIWIITWGLIVALIVVLVIIVRTLNKKLGVINFMKNKQEDSKDNEPVKTNALQDKIEKLKSKINGEGTQTG